MNNKMLVVILVILVMFSTAVFAQMDSAQYDSIKQQLMGMMTADQKTQFEAMTDAQQRQFVDQQIALANLKWGTAVTINCGGLCVEGFPVIWQVNVSNLGPNNFQLQMVSLTDSEGIIFAQRAVNLTIPPNQMGTIGVQGIVPPPSRSSTLFYKVVLVIDQTVQQEQGNRIMSLMPLSEVECGDNSTCPRDKFCIGYRCQFLTALPANKTGRPTGILEKGSLFYPIATIVLLLAIIIILIVMLPTRRK